MTQPSTPSLPAPLAGAGKTITQRLSDLEAAVNALIARAPTFATAQSVADLKAALDADRKAAETRQQELLKAVQASMQPPIVFPDVAGLQKIIQQHEQEIAELTARLEQPAPEPPDFAPLQTQIQGIMARLQEIEAALGLAGPADLPTDLPGRAALLADGRFTTLAAIAAATDADLDDVPGIGPATVSALRAFLEEEQHG
ncbi:hypothetical protein [Deinococcus sp. S9]|uniref:hypothetical protein n=1 Tax=Deinococcus sp. S9 TaxID=2545754 RepID=UPI0010549012|nr:hypothetical protein [Deinococcus sp. S9]TDE86002.1 hypothetical protein E0686_09175 [Deinococcus sp. S9]